MSDRRQHLAAPFGAAYCLGGQSTGLALSACEYDSSAAADLGARASARAFGAIAHREVHVNGTATLTILQSPWLPESEARAQAAVTAFASAR